MTDLRTWWNDLWHPYRDADLQRWRDQRDAHLHALQPVLSLELAPAKADEVILAVFHRATAAPIPSAFVFELAQTLMARVGRDTRPTARTVEYALDQYCRRLPK
jgi:hypothetical protein